MMSSYNSSLSNDRALLTPSLAVAIFLLVSLVPPSLAGSMAPGADQYESGKDRSLESLTGHVVDENHFVITNGGGVSATVTHIIYKDGGIDYVDIPDATLLPNETAFFNIEHDYTRLGVFSARGWLYPISSGSGDSTGENVNVTTTVEGNTEPSAPVTVMVHSEKRVFYTSADENGHFQVTVENLSGENHTVKIVAGDANRNGVADGPYTGGWQGFAENSYESSLEVGEHKTVSIPLKYDPLDLKMGSESGSVSAKTTTRSWSWKDVGKESFDRWEDYKVFDEKPSRFYGAEGWKVNKKSVTKWKATWYTNISQHSLGTFETRRDADYACRGIPNLVDVNIEKVPRYDWDWKVEWETSTSHSKIYDEKANAKDKKSDVGGSITKVSDSTDEWCPSHWNRWTTREWNPHHKWHSGHWEGGWDYVYDYKVYSRGGSNSGTATFDEYKGSSFTNSSSYHYAKYNYSGKKWDTTDEWVSGHWEGDYEIVHHKRWVDGHWESGYDYKVKWTTTKSHSWTYRTSARARLAARNVGGSVTKTNKEQVDTDYRCNYTTGKSHTKTFDSKSEASSKVGSYGYKYSVTKTGYQVKRAVYKTPRQRMTRYSRVVTGWNSESEEVQVQSKNGFSGEVNLSSLSEGASVDLPSSVRVSSSATASLSVKPHRSGTHSVAIKASPRDSLEPGFSESTNYSLSARADLGSWTTSTPLDPYLRKEPVPGKNNSPTKFDLTVVADGPGQVGTPRGDVNNRDVQTYERGKMVVLTAKSDSDATHKKWIDESGNSKGIPRTKQITVPMDSDKTRKALFSKVAEKGAAVLDIEAVKIGGFTGEKEANVKVMVYAHRSSNGMFTDLLASGTTPTKLEITPADQYVYINTPFSTFSNGRSFWKVYADGGRTKELKFVAHLS